MNASMKFYNEKEHLYLKTDVSGVSLGVGHLQAWDGKQLKKMKYLTMQHSPQ